LYEKFRAKTSGDINAGVPTKLRPTSCLIHPKSIAFKVNKFGKGSRRQKLAGLISAKTIPYY